MIPQPAPSQTQQAAIALAAAAMAIVVKAKMHVATYHPFYGALLTKLKLIADHRHPTMYTDAVVIGFSPTFVMGLPWEHVIYILAHEVMHCALGHPFRRGNRNKDLWGQAIDHVVNLLLNRDPELAKMMPPDATCDKRFEGMSAEEVYSILEREDKQQQKPDDQQQDDQQQLAGATGDAGDCCDAGASGERPDEDLEEEESPESEDEGCPEGEPGMEGVDGDEEEGERNGEGEEEGSAAESTEAEEAAEGEGTFKPQGPLDQAEIEELARGWEEATMTATLAAGGDIDSSVQRAIGQARECPKGFQEYIDEFAQRCALIESSWNRPARRFEVYMPSRSNPGIKGMLLGIDTSGSIGDDQLALMEAAEQRLMDEYNLAWVENVYCDSRVRNIERFNAGDQISLANAKGGGGTWFDPVFRRALELERQGEEIAGVIYLSDLEGELTASCAQDAAHLPTLWVKTNPGGTREAPGRHGIVCCIYD